MSMINKTGKFATMQTMPALDELVQALFLKMPELTFEADKTRLTGLSMDEVISGVSIYVGNQKVGRVSAEKKYVHSQGISIETYAITSPKIHKSRGSNRSTRYAKDVKSIINIAKVVLVPDSKDVIAENMIYAFKNQFSSIIYTGSRDYRGYAERLGGEAFTYVLELLAGRTPPIPQKIVSEVQSEKFKVAHDTCRIIQSLNDAWNTNSGVIVRVERDGTISVADVLSNSMTMEVKSTYDLPKNYQEKFTILKIMDKNTPIEHVGIKVETEVQNQPCTLYYLVGGETVVTH